MNARKRFILSGIVVLAMLSLTIGPSTAQSICPDPYEPNDAFKDAWNLKPPDTIQSYICQSGDLDYYSFSAKYGDVLDLSLYKLPANYDLCLYGPDEALIACSSNSGITDETIQVTASSSGDHYALVYGLLGAHDSGDSYTLDVQVRPQEPDLIVTDVWSEGGTKTSSICYQIRNIGGAVAPGGHYTFLYVDGQQVDDDLVDVDLTAGERLNRCFSYVWQCSPPDDYIKACADGQDFVTESDETNNCTSETWKCDTAPPTITSGPIVFDVLQTSAVISWTTDEDSDSVAAFGRYAGGYEEQEDDATLLQEHQITLTGLQPSTVYHYVVRSTDASSNTVTSDEGLFETSPIPGGEPPSLASPTITRVEGDRELYRVTVPVSDALGIERVEFYMDESLIGIDYSADLSVDATPVVASAGSSAAAAQYEFYLDPAARDTPRTKFFSTTHMMRAEAYDWSGSWTPKTRLWAPEPEPPPINLTVWPSYHPVRYVDGPGGTLLAGTTINVQVNASEQGWWCDPLHPSVGGPVEHAVDRVVLEVDGTAVYTWYPSDDDDFEFPYSWDVGGLGVGTYSLRVRAYAHDGSQVSTIRRLSVEVGVPRLDVSRSVTRQSNYFRVQLTVENDGTASTSLDRIEDNIAGFQPISKTEAIDDYQVTSDCSPAAESCVVEIDLWNDTGGDMVTLGPGEEIIVEYLAAPILYPDLDGTSYAIGEDDVLVYQDSEIYPEAFDRPCEMTDDDELLAAAVGFARGASDYLIVTDPDRLFDLYDDDEVNELLSAMADLAQLKTGVLGYVSPSDAGSIRETIVSWGSSMKGSDGIDNHYLTNGYLLLVGETDILPTFAYIDEGVADATSHWSGGSVDLIPLSDNGYADVNDDLLPDLIVGRLIGESAAQLIVQVQTSLDQPFWRDGATDSLVISGIGGGASSFEGNADQVADLLDDEFTVSQMYGSDYASDAARLTEFRARALDKDIIFYRDHGSANCWSRTVCEYDFPVDFGDSHPFAFGSACLTGDYEEGGDDVSIAEAFLNNGAGVYVGATERSPRSANNSAGLDFFERLTDDTHPLGQAFRETERALDTSNASERLWLLEYNLYGDPKYGGLYPPETGLDHVQSMLGAGVEQAQSSLDVTIPQYQVTTSGNLDYVDIPGPGGHILLTPDEPRVPIYVTSTIYAEGYEVQDVDLSMRSNLTTAMGLALPTVSGAPNGDSVQRLEATGAMSAGWYPEDIYDWRVIENPDGSSILLITIYPFYYNATTTSVRFYQDYSFDIRVISSTVAIESLTTDESAYPQGDEVLVDLWLNNSGDTQDVIVNAEVQTLGGEVVDGLLLRSLKGLTGTASFSLRWDSAGFEPGYYTIEATIKDSAGEVLDRQTRCFRLGVYSGEVTALTATPDFFDVGDTISTSLTFSNTGTVPITGTARIEIQDGNGEAVEIFTHDVTNLVPSDAVTFDDCWDTSGVEGGTYNVIGYVLYDSRSSNIKTVIVSSETYVYLPLVLRNR
jgi:hypothetical protein